MGFLRSGALVVASTAWIGAGVMSRPAMGWNPCNGYQCHMWAIGEAELRDIASSIATNGMLAAGYNFFCLDDGWQGPRLSNGSITANASAFPSGTLSPLAHYVSLLGLRFGTYTDRGGLTCEKYPGSKGHEVQDAKTYAAWGVRYVKEDSCNASEVEADREAEYSAMSAALAEAGDAINETIALSVCGWTPTYARFGAHLPPIGDSWRVGPDAGEWERFLVNIEGVAGASEFTGPTRGWPDVDMIGGQWQKQQERLRLSLVAVVGSPLILSWDVRNASASTLPLEVYLNAEVVRIHQDDAAQSQVINNTFYYRRIFGGAVTGSLNAAPVATHIPCNGGDVAAQWLYTPRNTTNLTSHADSAIGGTFETLALPGFCLSIWDLIPGGSCRNPLSVYLLPCNATHGAGGCPPSAQTWLTLGSSLAVAYSPPSLTGDQDGRLIDIQSDLTTARLMQALRASLNPFPGRLLSASGVPSALFVQPIDKGTTLQPGAQGWATTIAQNPSGAGNTTIASQVVGGGCLGAVIPGSSNVWARWLSGGDIALLLFNVASSAAVVVCPAVGCLDSLSAARGTSPPAHGWSVRDVWSHTDNGTIPAGADYVTPLLAADGGSVLLRLSPRLRGN